MKSIVILCLLALSQFLNAQVFPVTTVINNGSDAQRINYVILSDGYTSGQLPTFITNATSISTQIFNKTPFKEYSGFFNVYAIEVPSNESGADHPGTATDVTEPVAGHPVIDVDNYFGSTFDYGNIHRLLVPVNSAAVNSVVATNYPGADQVVILANSTYYGGSGGTYATSSLNVAAAEVTIHEIGHSFASLADEYWAGDIYAAEKPNMTAEVDPALVRWADWVGESGVGVYVHGASGTPANWYRPHQSCEMRALSNEFCGVCRETIIDEIYALTDPIDSYVPASNMVSYSGTDIPFSLGLVLPDPNTLSIEWVMDGTSIGTGDNVIINSSNLPLETNTLVANVTDETLLSKSYLPASGYTFSVSWTITNTLLPVELIDFQAIIKGQVVELFWETSTELNVEKYEIERSYDALNFEKIDELDIYENTSTLQRYTVIDQVPLDGKSYYRLKIVDRDGKFEYSPIRVVNRVEKFFFKVFPNPTQDIIYLNYFVNSYNKNISVDILNVNGEQLKTTKAVGSKGQHELQVDVSIYPSGIYFIQINNNNFSRRLQFIKK